MISSSSGLSLEILFTCSVLIYGVVLSRYIPDRFHWPANILAIAVSIIFGLSSGLSLTQMGLGLRPVLSALLVTLLVSLSIFVIVLGANVVPFVRQHFLKQASIINSRESKLIFESVIRIPLSTALVEEVLFRGVLLGMFLQYQSTLSALITSSLVFGLWHIWPTVNGIKDNENHVIAKASSPLLSKVAHVSIYVIATGSMGVIFGWFRILAGSIFAPWLLHWTINASGILAVVVAGRISRREQIDNV